MFAIEILNYGVELEVVKGLAFALLCFAVGVGVGLVRSSCCLLFCRSARGGDSEQINQSGAVAVSARTIAKIIIFRFSTGSLLRAAADAMRFPCDRIDSLWRHSFVQKCSWSQ